MPDDDKQTGKPFVPLAPIIPPMRSPDTDAAQGWSAFCDQLKHAGHQLLSQPGIEAEILEAESLRYLIRELRAGLEWYTELAIYDFPRFCRGDDSGSGPPGPNIDNTYFGARVR